MKKSTATEIIEAVEASGKVVGKAAKTAVKAVKVVKESADVVIAEVKVSSAIKKAEKDGTVTPEEQADIDSRKEKVTKEKADIKIAIDQTAKAAQETKEAAKAAKPELEEAGKATASKIKELGKKLFSKFKK